MYFIILIVKVKFKRLLVNILVNQADAKADTYETK